MSPWHLLGAIVFCGLGAAACGGRLFEKVPDAACNPSVDAACDEAELPVVADPVLTGIAGVAASRSDVCLGECCPCSPTQVSLEVFATASLLDDPVAAEAVVAEPGLTVAVDERYQQGLAAGFFLVCVATECVPVEVLDGAVTTVNVVVGFGLLQILTFDVGGAPGVPSFEVVRR